MSKEDLLMPARSDSSCSLGKISVDLSSVELYSTESGTRQSNTADTLHVSSRDSGDTIHVCDTSSEVSDEGYKSSQGNVSNKLEDTGDNSEKQLETQLENIGDQGERFRDFYSNN